VAALFIDDGVMTMGEGSIRGRDRIRRHLIETVGDGRSGMTEGRLHALLMLSPVVTLDRDYLTARGRWHVMKLSGEFGKSAQWEGGILENEYVREGGAWKIRREVYYPQFKGPYEDGWRNLVRETKETVKPVPYHYDPDRAGDPIPMPATGAALRLREKDRVEEVVAGAYERAQRLNDMAAVQNLQHIYGFYVDRKMWDDVADLFTEDGTLEIGQQGVFVGKAGIRRGLSQFGAAALEEGEVNDHLQLNTIVTIAPDGRSAKARGTQLRMTGKNGVGAQWGIDTFENAFVKQDGTWRLSSVHVYHRMTTDYKQGWGKDAQPAPGPNPSFPADRPPTRKYASYPKVFAPPIHFDHPAKAVSFKAKSTPPAMDLDAMIAQTRRLLAIAEAFDASENISNAYGYYIDEFLWMETGDLFALDGWKELSYIGTYVGRDRVRDSMIKRYGLNGRRPNSLAIHQKTQPVIHVASDGRSARIRSRLFQVNGQTDGEGSYIAGVYENETVLENGVWKIQGMDLDYTWTTGYKAGWANVAGSESRRFAPQQPALAQEYPPDRPLRGVVYAPFPKIADVAFHYRNPVSGREPPLLLR
jgi:hypothetical protein